MVRAVRQSGAIDEVSTTVHEAVIAARDGTKEINEIAKALKDAAAQVEETFDTTHKPICYCNNETPIW